MKQRIRKKLLLGVFLSFTGGLALACGPFFTTPVYHYRTHPDFPFTRYAQGRLGIIQPAYAQSYLFVAYRYLVKKPLTPSQQSAMLDLWQKRLLNAAGADGIANSWLTARLKVPGVSTLSEIESYRSLPDPNQYESYLNCPLPAFRNAADTLNRRIQAFGRDNANVPDWVKAQDTVFSNCSKGMQLPEKASKEAPAVFKQDRAYQTASAYFYAGKFDEAIQGFQAIAQDSTSPWHTAAPYLIARANIRKATLQATKPDQATALLTLAKSQLKSILQDPAQQNYHEDAQSLIDFVDFRLNPDQRRRALSQTLLQANPGPHFQQYVSDYTDLLEQEANQAANQPASTKIAIPPTEDMTDWVLTFQSEDASATPHAIARWQETKSQPWLLCAMSKIKSNDKNAPNINALLSAAQKTAPGEPAYPALQYHRARLLSDSGQKNAAHALLNQTLSHCRTFCPQSTANLLHDERLLLGNRQEFLQDAIQPQVGDTYIIEENDLPNDLEKLLKAAKPPVFPSYFSEPAIAAFNFNVPVSVLGEFALQPQLAPNIRRDLLAMVWLRSYLLKMSAVNQRFTPILAKAQPALAPCLKAYALAGNPSHGNQAQRDFEATYCLLKFPGWLAYLPTNRQAEWTLSYIDSYSDKWWERLTAPGSLGKSTAFPAFLTPAEKQAAMQERKKLIALPPAIDFLTLSALAWAKENPQDARAPEALHLAVAGSRFTQSKHSHEAFDWLHQHYPHSVWTRKTPYWY